MKIADLFSGIGGFTLALEAFEDMDTVVYCDIDTRSQAVLRHRISEGDLPKAEIHDDVQTLQLNAVHVDMIIGGFPCTGFSVAGAKQGTENVGSGLVRELYRLMEESRPQFVMMENVGPIVAFEAYRDICSRMYELGYTLRWTMMSAAELGAPHTRSRWWGLAVREDVTPGSVVIRKKKGYEMLYNWNTAEPPRMVPGPRPGDSVARSFLLGNTLCPTVARVAFLSLLTGLRMPLSELVSKDSWTYDTVHVGRPRKDSRGMRCGVWHDNEFCTVVQPVNDLGLARSWNLVLDPSAYVSEKPRCLRKKPSPLLTEPRHMERWTTPRTSGVASNFLSKRTCWDLPTQIQFEVRTEHRYGHLNLGYLDWMQGYPYNWTRITSEEKL